MSALELAFNHGHLALEILVSHELPFDSRHRMQNRRMRLLEFVRDIREGQIRQPSREIHGDLTRPGHAGRPPLALHIRKANIKMLGDKTLDMLHRHLRGAFLEE